MGTRQSRSSINPGSPPRRTVILEEFGGLPSRWKDAAGMLSRLCFRTMLRSLEKSELIENMSFYGLLCDLSTFNLTALDGGAYEVSICAA